MLSVLLNAFGSGVASAVITGDSYDFNDDLGTYNVYFGGVLWYASVPCPKVDPGSADPEGHRIFSNCVKISYGQNLGFLEFATTNPPPPIKSGQTHGFSRLASLQANLTVTRAGVGAHSQAAMPATLDLGSSTPLLPLLGNKLVFSAYVPNSTTLADTSAAYATGLRRGSDCSLSEDFVLTGGATPNEGRIASIPGADAYLHQLAGLTTTAGAYPNGCKISLWGQPSVVNALLQPTANGGAISATIAGGSLLAYVNDPVANTLTQATLLSSGTNPSLSAIAYARLTAGSNVDLVASFATNPTTHALSTAVFVSNGNGTFKAPVYYDVPGDVTIDDVNGDGNPDVVVCGSTPGIVTLIGHGDGTFTASARSAATITACGGASGEMVTGDLNGDGKKDLVVQGRVLLGQGNGTFTAGAAISSSAFLQHEFGNAAIGDVNKDGKLDIVLSEESYVAVLYGKGNGTFTDGPRYAAIPGPTQVSLADMDGDGNLDILVGTSTSGVYIAGCCAAPKGQVLMGRGDGTFVDAVVYPEGFYGNGLYTVAGPQIATSDFNADGKVDVLVYARLQGVLSLLPGDGSAALGTAVTSPVTALSSMLVTADMNGDGKPDVVLGGGAGVSVLLNGGSGTFASEHDYALPSPVVSLVTGDFNGDGRMDVAAGVNPGMGVSGTTGTYVLYGQPSGSLGSAVKIDSSLYPTGLAAADLNGDGKTDLFVADQGNLNLGGSAAQVNGALHIYLGQASGTFTTATAPTTVATNYSVAALGDINGDGKQDLIVAGNRIISPGVGAPAVYALLGNGNGTFQAATEIPLVGLDLLGATAIATADFNKDGHLDVAIGNAYDYTELLLGTGDGKFANTVMALGDQPLAVAAADLNADGFPELLIGSQDAYGAPGLAVFVSSTDWSASTTNPGTATTTTLAVSPTAPAVSQSVTLTATVVASGGGLPTGSVSFIDGAATIGSGAVSAQGKATFATATLAAGTHSISARYGGDATFAASTSTAVSVVVGSGTGDFAISADPTSGSVTAGASATSTLTITPSGGFTGTVTLACSGLPAGATCSFSPASVSVTGTAAVTTTLSISTMASAYNQHSLPGGGSDPLLPTGTLLAGVVAPVYLRRRRRAARQMHAAWSLLMLALVFASALYGCGGGSSSGGSTGGGGTTPGMYTVTVTATSGAHNHGVTYQLTVN